MASDATRKAVTSTGPLNDGCPGTVDGNGAAPSDAPQLRTRAVHAGEDVGAPVRPLTRPIVQSSVYAFRDPAVADARFAADPPAPNYSRDGLPNVRALARAVAELEGAEAGYAAASGMAASAGRRMAAKPAPNSTRLTLDEANSKKLPGRRSAPSAKPRAMRPMKKG